MLRLALPVLLQGHDKLLLQAFLRGPTTKTIKSLLTGTVTTQSPLTGTGAIQSPLVGTGTFQSNSPVGIGSVHDIHASNIDLNAQAQTEMLSNPFMWMFNMPNQQDFWKDFIDKRVQEALNPTLLRSAATFISNTTTSVSTGVSCTTNTTMSTVSNVRRRFDKFSNNNDYEDVSEEEFEFSVLARNQSLESKSDNGDNENPDQNSVAGTCSDQVFVDHADIKNNFSYTNLMCKVASELGITVDSEKSQEVQYLSVSDHLSCDKQITPHQDVGFP